MKLRPSMPLFLILVVLCVAGCASVTPHSGGEIGVLRVSGPNVWLNDAPASDGDPVRFGNSVTTGAGSSAKVEFTDGGYLQLDQNTDPIFEWLEQSKCILIRIVKGQAYLKKERACVEGPNIAMVLNSEVNLRVQPPPAPSEVTVVRGSVEVTQPVPILLIKGQQMTTTVAGRAPAVRTLSPDQLRSIAAWQREYRFAPLRPRDDSPIILLPPRSPREPREPRPGGPAQPDPASPPPGTKPTTPPTPFPGGLEPLRRAPVLEQPEPVIR